MVCPICELKVEEVGSDEFGKNTFVCCRCKALITVQELTDTEICDDGQD